MAVAIDPIGASRILVYGVTGSGKSTLAGKIAWHFRSFQRKRSRIRAWAADPKGPAVLRVTKPAQADRLLDQLGSTQPQK